MNVVLPATLIDAIQVMAFQTKGETDEAAIRAWWASQEKAMHRLVSQMPRLKVQLSRARKKYKK